MNITGNYTHQEPEELQWGFLAFIAFLMIACIVCNVLILAAFTFEKTIRNQTNTFVVSLACADLVVGMVSMPIWIASNTVTLYYLKAIDLLCCSASILNCALLSLERALKITCPYWYANKVTNDKVKFVIFLGWLASIVVGGSSLIRKNDKDSIPYISFISVVIYAFPVLAVVISYISIFVVARKHAHKIRNQNCQIARKSVIRQQSDAKIAWRLGIFIAVFIICWTPVFITVWIRGEALSVYVDYVYVVSCTLPYVNAVINPFLYALTNPSLRKAMKRLYTRKSFLQNTISLNKRIESSTLNININRNRNSSQFSPKIGRRDASSLLKRDPSNVPFEESSAFSQTTTTTDGPLLEMEPIWETSI